MTEPAEALLPRRRRWRRLLLLLVPLALLAVAWFCLVFASNQRLRRAVAEADRLDPHWRLDDLLAERAAVPDGENAALTVLAAAGSMPPDWPALPPSVARSLDHLEPNESVNDAQAAALRAELGRVAAVLQEARKLADQSRGCWPGGLRALDVKVVARLLSADALLRAREGDLDGALASCRALLNAGRSAGDEPSLTPQLVRAATDAQAADQGEYVLGQGEPSEAALAALQELLAGEAEEPLLTIGLRGERARADRFLEAVGHGDMTIRQMVAAYRGPPTTRLWVGRDDLLYLPGMVTDSRAALLERMTRLVELSRLSPPEQRGPLAELAAQPKDERLLVRVEAPAALARYAEQLWSSQARLRCAATALAAERYRHRHGRWPEALDELTGEFLRAVPLDPFDGRPLRYSKDDGGVVVYSVGPDGKEGGELRFRLWDANRRRQAARS
jgi:hypothetical protein